MAFNINKPVPGAKEFYPLNEPAIGTALSSVGARPSNIYGPPALKTSALSPGDLPSQ